MRGCFVVLLLCLVMCEFVIGASSSVVETNFVINNQNEAGDVAVNQDEVSGDLDFWSMYGDYFIAGVIVLIVAVFYLNTIKGKKKKRRK